MVYRFSLFINPSNPTVPMPNPTLKDIVPLLDVLNRDIKFSRVIKHDLYGRASMFKTLNELNAMDIESMVIETLNLGLAGNTIANTLRNLLAEIAARINDLRFVNPQIDRKEKSPEDAFDRFQREMMASPIQHLQCSFDLYNMACGRLTAANEENDKAEKANTDKYFVKTLPVGLIQRVDKHRKDYIKSKRILMTWIQRSIEFEENLEDMCTPQLRRAELICSKISKVISRYFPPCEIIIPKMPTQYEEERNNKGKQNQQASDDKTESKREPRVWIEPLFPMILVSELYEVCEMIFEESTETQFHSSLNLHGKHEPLRIKPKQKIKVCYLISKLYDIVPEKHKVAWREDILLHFDIDASYYESKYSHPRGSDASRSSMAFADDIDEIIKNHKKRA